MPAEDERTALYRLYDSKGSLLYVGITADPEARWKGHSHSVRSSAWWPQVAKKSIEWFPSRLAAYEAETKAIQTEKPIHNRAMRSDGRGFHRWRYWSQEIRWVDRHLNPWSDQIARILRAEIARGVIRPGDIMPTARQLHQRFGVSDQTCGKVLRLLADEGLLHQKRKGGRYYCTAPDRDTTV